MTKTKPRSRLELIRLPRTRLELYRTHDGWRFRAIAGNGKIVGASEEGIKQRKYAINRAVRQFSDRPVIIVDSDGTWELASQQGAK